MRKLFRYTFYRIAKRIIRFFVAFSLILSICFGSIFYQYEKVEAASVGALGVVGAIGSILGIANVTSGGSVTGMFAEQKDKIQQWWSDFTNSGDIYVDSNNNYVFSGTATNALYESLDSNSNMDAKVCSSFPSNSLNVPVSFYTHINSWIASNNYNNKDILKFYCDVENDDKSTGKKTMYYYYIGNVAYIVLTLRNNSNIIFNFYNDNGQKISVPFTMANCYLSRGDFFGTSSEDGFTDYGSLNYTSSYTSDYPDSVLSRYQGYFQSLDNAYNFFPYQNFYCSRSLIVSKNGASAISLLNKKEGLYITNNYYGSQIPPISKTVFEENNWDSVYNSFINNVNTNNENWYVNEGVDVQALRDEMAKQSNIIKDAITQGNIDIADKIDYTNEWLKKIYNLLKEIKTTIANNQGCDCNCGGDSGGSGGGSGDSGGSGGGGLSYVFNISVTGGYNGGADVVVDVSSSDYSGNILTSKAIGDSYNSNYEPLSNSVGDIGAVITPPSSHTSPFYITVNVGSVSQSSNPINSNGSNNSYGYNFNQSITLTVDSGTSGDGSSSVDLSSIEDKLDLVNTNFSELITKLDGVSGDLEAVMEALYSIESFSQAIDSDLDQLQQQYLVLSNIYSYMQSHPWGSGGGGGPFITPTEDPWEPWFKYIDDEDNDFPYDAILTKYNVIKTLIQAAAPYCFISFIGGVFNAFSTEAVTPEFVIPIKVSNSIINIDEEVQVDLSYLDDIIVYIHAAFIILVTVGLMWFSFPFIRNLIQIFEL